MATWQAEFLIVGDGSFPCDYQQRLDAIAPRYASWSDAVLAWGEEDGNRITVLLEDGAPDEASFRVDMRNPDTHFIEEVLGFVRSNGFSLQDELGRHVPAQEREFALALKGCRAFRFVEDPEFYLRRLELGGLADA